MNKQAYLQALREELPARFQWARDRARLERYLARAEEFIQPDAKCAGFEFDGDASAAAWQSIGGKGKPKLRELRALP